MNVKKQITRESLKKLMSRLLSEWEVIAPTKMDGVTRFSAITSEEEVIYDFTNTVTPPKDWFFPQTEEMFHFSFTLGEATIEQKKTITQRDCVLFGVRPCDLKSIGLLDNVFLGEVSGEPFTDNFYLAKRKKTTIIGLSCTAPASACFCTAFSLSPTDKEHADLMLTELSEGQYLAEAVTDKGEKFMNDNSTFFSDAGDADKEDLAEEVKSKVRAVDFDGVYEKMPAIFESEIWDELAEKCLGCGVCTYVCPTCHCFDISDEYSGTEGKRVRAWDSCMFANFTQMAGGHNPRPSQKERVRQRFFHKLRYFQERYQKDSLCVGCGRCIVKCPVNIDITKIISDVKELS